VTAANPLADQMAAASRHSKLILQSLQGPLGGVVVEAAPPGYLEAFAARHNAEIKEGRGRSCGHLTSPQPVFCAVWLPGLTVCRSCAAAGALLPPDPATDPENDTCDRCQQHVPGGISLSAAQSNLYVIIFGLCWPCHHVTGSALR
jgi:hypothetical protein